MEDELREDRTCAELFAALAYAKVPVERLQDVFREPFPCQRPLSNRTLREQQACGFLSVERAFWLTRNELGRRKTALGFFDDGQAPAKGILAAARGQFDDWISNRVPAGLRLEANAVAWIKRRTRIDVKELGSSGAPICATFDGIVWLALTRDRAIVWEDSPKQRAIAIQRLIQRFPVQQRHRWVSLIPVAWSIEELARVEPARFRCLQRDVLHATLQHTVTCDPNITLEALGSLTLAERTSNALAFYQAATPGNAIALRAELEAHSTQIRTSDVDTVVLCTSATADAVTPMLQEFIATHKPRKHFVVLDRDDVRELLGALPWFWTSHTPAHSSIQVTPRRVGDELTYLALPGSDHSRVPMLPAERGGSPRAMLRATDSVLLVGGPESGKTTQLRRLLRIPPQELAVFQRGLEFSIAGTAGGIDATLLEHMVRSVPHDQRIIIAFDDLENTNTTALQAIVRLQEEEKRDALRVVVAARTQELALPLLRKSKRGIHVVVLDKSSAATLRNAAAMLAEKHHVNATAEQLDELVTYECSYGGGTVGALDAYLRRAASKPLLVPRVESREEAAVTMINRWRRGRPEDRVRFELLRAIAVFADVGIVLAPVDTVQRCTRAVLHTDVEVTVAAWSDVTRRKCFEVWDSYALTDTLPMAYFQFGLWDKNDSAPWRMRVWLRQHLREADTAQRYTFLFWLRALYDEFAPRQAPRIRRQLIAQFPYERGIDLLEASLASAKRRPLPPEVLERAPVVFPVPPTAMLLSCVAVYPWADVAAIAGAWVRQRPEWISRLLQVIACSKSAEAIPHILRSFCERYATSRKDAVVILSALFDVALRRLDVVSDALVVIQANTHDLAILAAVECWHRSLDREEFHQALATARSVDASIGWPEGQWVPLFGRSVIPQPLLELERAITALLTTPDG